MPRLKIASLQEQLKAMQIERDNWKNDWAQERTKRTAAEESLKESREHFADLKERLANAEAEAARMRGYLDRVHEDDVVRDGMIEIEDGDGKRMVPKRPTPMRPVQHVSHDEMYAGLAGRKKRTHWTSY